MWDWRKSTQFDYSRSSRPLPLSSNGVAYILTLIWSKQRATFMNDSPTPLTHDSQTKPQVLSKMGRKKKILVFSPDRDLAQSLSMLFENHFEITCETSMGELGKRIASVAPALLIVDLHTFSSDVMLELSIVESSSVKVPVVILRAYNRLRSDVEEMVQRTAQVVFYKPFNAEEVVRSIHNLMKVDH